MRYSFSLSNRSSDGVATVPGARASRVSALATGTSSPASSDHLLLVHSTISPIPMVSSFLGQRERSPLLHLDPTRLDRFGLWKTELQYAAAQLSVDLGGIDAL